MVFKMLWLCVCGAVVVILYLDTKLLWSELFAVNIRNHTRRRWYCSH